LNAAGNLLLIEVDPRGDWVVVALRSVAVRTASTVGLVDLVSATHIKLTPALRALGYKKPATSTFSRVSESEDS
jgi:hypothetical protein